VRWSVSSLLTCMLRYSAVTIYSAVAQVVATVEQMVQQHTDVMTTLGGLVKWCVNQSIPVW
jgi:hypothetical protein